MDVQFGVEPLAVPKHRIHAQLASTAIEALLPYKDKIYTITADNGKEFARHKEIAKGLDAEFYFVRPYHSWERGANENTNGLIRQYIPKGTDKCVALLIRIHLSPSTHQRIMGMRRIISYRSGDREKTAMPRMRYIATGGSCVWIFNIYPRLAITR